MEIVLFDVDGTLTDPLVGIAAALDRAMVGLGCDRLSAAQHRAAVGPPLQDVFAGLGLAPGQVETAVALYREYYRDRGLLENQVYPGNPETLAQLRATGLRLGVATSKPEPRMLQPSRRCRPPSRRCRAAGSRPARSRVGRWCQPRRCWTQ